jgi:uncharacterized 2Fe-2S/4Fe-4S cluster protein (DUF4445 family)
MNTDFDPYDVLMQTMERLARLEHAHNILVNAFKQSEQDLNSALRSLQALQKQHMNLMSKQAASHNEIKEIK